MFSPVVPRGPRGFDRLERLICVSREEDWSDLISRFAFFYPNEALRKTQRDERERQHRGGSAGGDVSLDLKVYIRESMSTWAGEVTTRNGEYSSFAIGTTIM